MERKIRIKCPHCNNEDIDVVSLISQEICSTEGITHECCYCYNCENHFYVFTILDVKKIGVSKEKYTGYEIIYPREE